MIAQRLWAEFPGRQSFEQPVPLFGPRDDQYAIAALQARFDERERRLGERVATTILAFGIAVELGEVSPRRGFNEEGHVQYAESA